MKETDEKLQTALEVQIASKEVAVMEAKQQVVTEFKDSEEYKLANQDFEAGYDEGVKEIFYNL